MEHWNNVKRDARFQRIFVGMELQTEIRIQHHIVSDS